MGNLWHSLKPGLDGLSLWNKHISRSAPNVRMLKTTFMFSAHWQETLINRRVNVDNLKEQFTTTTFIFALACNSYASGWTVLQSKQKIHVGENKLPRNRLLKNKRCCKPFHAEIIFSVKRSASVCAKRLMLMTAWQELNINNVPFGWAAILGSSKDFSWRM